MSFRPFFVRIVDYSAQLLRWFLRTGAGNLHVLMKYKGRHYDLDVAHTLGDTLQSIVQCRPLPGPLFGLFRETSIWQPKPFVELYVTSLDTVFHRSPSFFLRKTLSSLLFVFNAPFSIRAVT